MILYNFTQAPSKAEIQLDLITFTSDLKTSAAKTDLT